MVSSVIHYSSDDSCFYQTPAFTTGHIRELTDLVVAKSAEASRPQNIYGGLADTTPFVASRHSPGESYNV